MRYAGNCVRLSLCAVLAITATAIDVQAQATSGDTAATIAALEKGADALDLQKPPNYPAAYALYLQAANLGSAYSQWQVGWMNERGHGVPQSYSQAIVWYKKAAIQARGHVYTVDKTMGCVCSAAARLGMIYWLGWGVPRDLAQAREWAQLAVSEGDSGTVLAQINNFAAAHPAAQPAPAQPAPAPQQDAPQQGQGICAAVYIVFGMDATYGTHVFYGAAWSRISYADALAGAKTELMKVVTGDEVDPRQLPGAGGQYAAKPEQGSGCTYAHGAVAGALKIRPSGGSMWNPGGAAGTSILGPGIYDIIDASFGDSTDGSASAALSKCQTRPHVSGGGDSDHETCTVLQQW
jgi:hypothetical protein